MILASELSAIMIAMCLFILVVPVSGVPFSVNLQLSSQRAMLGDTLQATCDVHNSEQKRMLLVWIRKTPSDNLEVEIATNGFVNANFKRSGRYRSAVEHLVPLDYRRVLFTLNITNVTSEDSGHIGCRLTVENERMSNISEFQVVVPMQNVKWMSAEPNAVSYKKTYSDNQQTQFNEGDVKWFLCQVNGSYPKPEVKVFLGDTDITSLFRIHNVLVKGDGPPGLQSLYYKTDVYNKTLHLDYLFHDQILKCTASLAQLEISDLTDASSLQRNSSIKISLLHKPKIVCKPVVRVKINQPNFRLICKVNSNPEVKLAKISWKLGHDANETLDDGNENNDYSANITMINEVETVMILTINTVSPQHFKTYVFEAENDIGRVTREISLEQDLLDGGMTGCCSHDTGFPLPVFTVVIICYGLVSST